MRIDEAVGAGIERGLTLPADWYTDESVLEREQELIFGHAWQYVGPLDDLARPGDFLTARLGRVPVIVVRDRDEELRAFVNVCRHRGSELVLVERGNRNSIQCHYHAWTYGLDGRLRAAPRADEQDGFEPELYSLVPLPLDTWGPLVFVSARRDSQPLPQVLGELPAIVEDAGLDLSRLRLRERSEYVIEANWKVVVDNYLECYHCPVAHPSFTALIDVERYETTEYELFSLQRGPARESERGPYAVGGAVEDGLYAFVWPNFTLNVYPGPGNVSVNLFVPLDGRRTLARFHYFFADEVTDAEVREFAAFVDQVQREDVVLCESVQRGLSSGFFDRGRLMLPRERGLQHFHRLVYGALAG